MTECGSLRQIWKKRNFIEEIRMRLIDADALIDDLEHDVAIDQDTLDFEELTEINRANIQFDKDCKQNAIDLLKNAPTIEPERKKGKWVETEFLKLRECSCCHAQWGVYSVEDFNFCPDCGSDMRGDQP